MEETVLLVILVELVEGKDKKQRQLNWLYWFRLVLLGKDKRKRQKIANSEWQIEKEKRPFPPLEKGVRGILINYSYKL